MSMTIPSQANSSLPHTSGDVLQKVLCNLQYEITGNKYYTAILSFKYNQCLLLSTIKQQVQINWIVNFVSSRERPCQRKYAARRIIYASIPEFFFERVK